ncbi:MAG TPA: hypothetical protein DCR20_01410 [Planctomycetaceae bacterium]|nr:hypothetical protein [Planctomycetaceae bacterium]
MNPGDWVVWGLLGGSKWALSTVLAVCSAVACFALYVKFWPAVSVISDRKHSVACPSSPVKRP